jgi:DNA-binding Xre family transcriptional regulator
MEVAMYKIDKVKVLRLMLDRYGDIDQKRLARESGLTEATVSRLISGKARWTGLTLSRLCKGLGCTPNDILILPEVSDPNQLALTPEMAPA